MPPALRPLGGLLACALLPLLAAGGCRPPNGPVTAPLAHPAAPDLDLRSPRVAALWSELAGAPGDGPVTVDRFLAGLDGGAPLIEPATREGWLLVTFLWRGEATRVRLLGGRPVTDFEAPMERLPGSDLWFVSQLLPDDSRFQYRFLVDSPRVVADYLEDFAQGDPPRPDPLNPRSLDEASYLVLPQAPPFPYPADPAAARGEVVDDGIDSAVLGERIELRVYRPAAETLAGGEPPWLTVAFDGGFEDMGRVMDDLIASRRVPPMVVVGVVNRAGKRVTDLGFSDEYARFLADELLPWARRRYATAGDRERTIVAGASRGGGMAAYFGLTHPQSVAHVLAISTALENVPGGFPNGRFWIDAANGWLVRQVIERERQPIDLYLAVGRFDTSLWTDRLVNNRRFRDVLRAKGYAVTYDEWNGGHDHLLFQRAYVAGLQALTGGAGAGDG